MSFLIRCFDAKKQWFEVDEYSFTNRKKIVNEKGNPIFDNAAIKTGNQINFMCESLSREELSAIGRYMGLKLNVPSPIIIEAPSFLHFKRGRGMVLRDLKTGESYRKVVKKMVDNGQS